ncbi:acyltransferase [Ideonella sp. A 288]|uniref:acyltransferase family protein n=1 Tax=Ideonella sp. A 288 TaxID=1962181 RepID=UPI001303B792|nr:acyltransferase [Ideonella sp. A 288]
MASLDGLRGVAALVVVAFHFLSAFAPGVVPHWSAQYPGWVASPVSLLFNGELAVSVFFVLSGFVLAASSLRPRRHLARDGVLRFVRLALPATASVVLAWCLLSAWPTAAMTLAVRSPGPWLGYTAQAPLPPFGAAVYEGLVGVFTRGHARFNNVLWTMRYELLGSLALFALFHLVRVRRWPVAWALCAVLACAPIHKAYLCFCLGALLLLAGERGWAPGARLSVLAVLVAVVLATPWSGLAPLMLQSAWPPALRPELQNGLLYPLVAVVLVAAAMHLPGWRRALSTPMAAWLGRQSFPIYLVHVPLLYTAAATAAVRFDALDGGRLVLLFVAYLAGTVALAVAFERAVDAPVLRLCARVKARSSGNGQ